MVIVKFLFFVFSFARMETRTLLEKIRKIVREAREERDVPPSRFKAHLFDCDLFRKVFGVSYREIIHRLSGPSLFAEISSIVNTVRAGGVVVPLIVDRDYVIVDGGTRALALAHAGMNVDRVLVLPIRCLENEENLIICTIIALWTLKGKGRTDELYRVYELVKAGFAKYGVDPSIIFGVSLEEVRNIIEPALYARASAVGVDASTVERDVLSVCEEVVSALGLPGEIVDAVGRVVKLIPPVKIFERLAEKRGWQRLNPMLYRRAVSAVARAYVYKVGKLVGVPEKVLRRLKSERIGDVVTRDLLNDAIYVLASEWRLLVSPEAEVSACIDVVVSKLGDLLKDVDLGKVREEAGKLYERYKQVINRLVASGYERAILAVYAASRKLGIKLPSLRSVFQRLGKTGPAASYILKRLRDIAERDDLAKELLTLLS